MSCVPSFFQPRFPPAFPIYHLWSGVHRITFPLLNVIFTHGTFLYEKTFLTDVFTRLRLFVASAVSTVNPTTSSPILTSAIGLSVKSAIRMGASCGLHANGPRRFFSFL